MSCLALIGLLIYNDSFVRRDILSMRSVPVCFLLWHIDRHNTSKCHTSLMLIWLEIPRWKSHHWNNLIGPAAVLPQWNLERTNVSKSILERISFDLYNQNVLRNTKTEVLSLWRNFRHWLHRKLSLWKIPVRQWRQIRQDGGISVSVSRNWHGQGFT